MATTFGYSLESPAPSTLPYTSSSGSGLPQPSQGKKAKMDEFLSPPCGSAVLSPQAGGDAAGLGSHANAPQMIATVINTGSKLITWQDAFEIAESMGGHLVTITSQEEDSF